MLLAVGFMLEAGLCLGALLLGARSRKVGHWLGLLAGVAVGVLVAPIFLGLFSPYSDHARRIGGTLMAGGLLGVVPQLAYHWLGYEIGRRLRARPKRRPVVLGWTWAGSLVVLAPYCFMIFLYSVTLLQCQAGQYDCPFG